MMFLADENLHGDITRGLLRRDPQLDLVRVQDVGLIEAPDDVVMEWAADHERVAITHDVNTLIAEAYLRLARGDRMPGVLAVRSNAPIGRAIEDILLVEGAVAPEEMEGQIMYLPFPSHD